MKAVILAAGRGSRLGNLTDDRPKCLLEVSGKTILAWILDALTNAAIESIGIVRGYKAEKLVGENFVTFDNEKWFETNMVSSLLCAEGWLSTDDCIISYADIVYTKELIDTLVQQTGEIIIPYNTEWLDVWTRRFDDPLSDAETFKVDRNGILQEIGGKASSIAEIEGQYMGLLKITPTGFAYIKRYLESCSSEQVKKMDMTTLLANLIKNNVVINTVPVSGQWHEIDNKKDMEVFCPQGEGG